MELQRAAILELRAAQIVQLSAVRQEADVDSLHHIVRTQAVHSGNVQHTALLLHLGRRVEGAQRTQLHRHTLSHQLRQAVRNLQQHTLHNIPCVDAAVLSQMLGESAQRQCLAGVHLRVVLAVSRSCGVLVLSEINPHSNSFV